MKVKEIRRPSKDKFEFVLEGDLGTIFLYFPPPSPLREEDRGMVCGTWCSAKNGDFMAMNNLAHYGNGPGIEKELSSKRAGEAAEWFWNQRLEWQNQMWKQEREEREKRRARRIASQVGLKGGLEV